MNHGHQNPMLKHDHGLLKISRASVLSLYKHSPELIPKIIHRIWLGNDPMPDSYIRFGKTWEKHHPGWIIKLWRDPEELPFKMRLHNIYKKATSRGKGTVWSAKSNFMRLEIIYNLGGIYIDTDFECIKSLEPLLSDVRAFVASRHRRPWATWRRPATTHARRNVSWCIFGAQPKHPWLEAMIRSTLEREKYQTRTVKCFTDTRHAVKRNSELIKKFKVKVFSREIFFPFLYHEKEEYQRDPRHFMHENTHAIHHWHGTWR